MLTYGRIQILHKFYDRFCLYHYKTCLSLQYSRSCCQCSSSGEGVCYHSLYVLWTKFSSPFLSFVKYCTKCSKYIISFNSYLKKKKCEGLYFPGKNKKFGQGSEAVKGVKKGI